MKILIWIKDFLLHLIRRILKIVIHLIRRILQIILSLLISIICGIIYAVTYEPGTYQQVTKRKVRRIRALTKLKLYIYKYFKPVCVFMHDSYLNRLYNKFHFLIDK